MYTAGKRILDLGCKSALLKGGHQETDIITSLYFDESGKISSFETEKFQTNNTHGSGCTFILSYCSLFSTRQKIYPMLFLLGQQYVLKL